MIAYIFEIKKSKVANIYFLEFDQSEQGCLIKFCVSFHPVEYAKRKELELCEKEKLSVVAKFSLVRHQELMSQKESANLILYKDNSRGDDADNLFTSMRTIEPLCVIPVKLPYWLKLVPTM